MEFKQFYLGCLAQASYLIGDAGEAAIVDPRRDVDVYIDEAKARGLTIRHVIETHLHADFVSGHRELAARTGAKIYFGARAGAAFEHVPVKDGDEIHMGDVTLRFLETPGHTPESVSVLVLEGGAPKAVLTGDTMFIGDVGRPDLLGARISPRELAGQLYDSLHQKLLALPDSVAVYPAHGAGSLCGRNISSETSSRSEEHTSELQSRRDLVCRLLLERNAALRDQRSFPTRRSSDLFIGDVGRPDLLGARISPRELAGQLYDSLHQKLLALPDSVAVYPAHGAGSLCGRNISSETSS